MLLPTSGTPTLVALTRPISITCPSAMNFGGDKAKAWKDIWGCGQGIGAISQVQSAADFVAQLKREYAAARQRLLGLV
jgi:nitronate monooxygenase